MLSELHSASFNDMMQCVSLTMFSLVLYVISFYFFFLEQILPNFVYFVFILFRLAFATSGARSFIVLLSVENVIKLSCLFYVCSEKCFTFKCILTQFRLIFN